MKRASAGLYAHVLNTLLVVDPRSRPLASTAKRVVTDLTVDEAERLPDALGVVMSLLHSDIDRRRLAAELAARLDLFELAPVIARIGIERDDSDLLMAATSLCGNPAADASARANLIAVKPDSRTIRIRLDPSATPVGQDEERLYLSL